MTFQLQAQGRNGQSAFLKAIIDTGACVNLVKQGFFESLMTPNKNPLTLVTANGEKLNGGDREVELDLSFKMKTKCQNEGNETDVFTLKGNLHEADIEMNSSSDTPGSKKTISQS